MAIVYFECIFLSALESTTLLYICIPAITADVRKSRFLYFFHVITSLFLSEKFDILILYSYNYIITKRSFIQLFFIIAFKYSKNDI